jgi:uncharacterized protein (DUF427 family)
VKAIWNGAVLAESDATIVVEGNHYFQPEAVNHDYLRGSDTHTRCYWKGVASYYTIEVNGKRNLNGAWYYPQPSAQAQEIAGYIAFWRGVQVVK